jgi:transposase InsO family protein
MSRQNYYKSRHFRQQRAVDEDMVLSLVRRERNLQPCLGGRKLLCRIGQEMTENGVNLGRDRFFGLLRRHELLILHEACYCRTTDSRHGFGIYGNILKDAVLTGPCQAVVSDITYIRTMEGFMYVSLVMDAFSRAILGYDCSDRLESEGALRALRMALKQLPSGAGVIHHSDRGCQYCCGAYVKLLGKHGFRISMTEKNHCYENSKAERLNGILKQEYGLGCRFLSKKQAGRSVHEAVWLYNYCRPHHALGYRYPMEVHNAA